jgi:hypothetical protein
MNSSNIKGEKRMNDLIKSPKRDPGSRLATKDKKKSSLQKYTLENLHKDYEETNLKMLVTSRRYDDIARILDSLNVKYEKYNGRLDCTILFLNCGTSDRISINDLRTFVNEGGCLYASDLTSSTISQAFPLEFNFSGNNGQTGRINAKVLDEELGEVIGENIEIYFDLGGWSVLDSVPRGKLILESATTRKPLMVMVPIGKGKVFYTCFHNHAQTSRAEQILLQLLVLKQVSTVTGTSLEQTSKSAGVSLIALRNEMKKLKSGK